MPFLGITISCFDDAGKIVNLDPRDTFDGVAGQVPGVTGVTGVGVTGVGVTGVGVTGVATPLLPDTVIVRPVLGTVKVCVPTVTVTAAAHSGSMAAPDKAVLNRFFIT